MNKFHIEPELRSGSYYLISIRNDCAFLEVVLNL